MNILSEDRRLKTLLAFGGIVLIAIIGVFMFGFDTDIETKQEKIGFIILGDIHEAGWNASHYSGIKSACDEFGIELLVKDNVKENSGQCPAAIEELAHQGAGMIFLASFAYSSEAKDIVERYPNIAFATSATKVYTKNMTAYFA